MYYTCQIMVIMSVGLTFQFQKNGNSFKNLEKLRAPKTLVLSQELTNKNQTIVFKSSFNFMCTRVGSPRNI